MPNLTDYNKDGDMLNPYFMDDHERSIYYAGYRDGRRSYAFEKKWKHDNPLRNFRSGVKEDYLRRNVLGPEVEELEAEYKIEE